MSNSAKSIDYLRLGELYADLDRFIKSIHGLYLDACLGFFLINRQLSSRESELIAMMGGKSSGLLNFLNFSHESFYGDEFAASGIHRPKVIDVKVRTKANGHNVGLVGKMCVISLFSYWENYLRGEIEKAKGLNNDELKHVFWGDLRLLRNRIVHENEKTEIGLQNIETLKSCLNGSTVEINDVGLREVILGCLRYRNELYKESQPPREPMRVPKSS